MHRNAIASDRRRVVVELSLGLAMVHGASFMEICSCWCRGLMVCGLRFGRLAAMILFLIAVMEESVHICYGR